MFFFVTLFKSVTEYCTSSTVCITLYCGVLRVHYMWIINVKIPIWGKMCNKVLSLELGIVVGGRRFLHL